MSTTKDQLLKLIDEEYEECDYETYRLLPLSETVRIGFGNNSLGYLRKSPPKPKSLTMKVWDAFISKSKRHDDSLTMDDAMMIVHVIEEHLKEQG